MIDLCYNSDTINLTATREMHVVAPPGGGSIGGHYARIRTRGGVAS